MFQWNHVFHISIFLNLEYNYQTEFVNRIFLYQNVWSCRAVKKWQHPSRPLAPAWADKIRLIRYVWRASGVSLINTLNSTKRIKYIDNWSSVNQQYSFFMRHTSLPFTKWQNSNCKVCPLKKFHYQLKKSLIGNKHV
jgi:hypothetical protein